MNLNDLLSETTAAPSLIAKEIDPEKHAKIVATLCEKRKSLEEKVAAKDPDSAEAAISLFELKGSMSLFGITEIEYMAYVEKIKEVTTKPKIGMEVEKLDNTG